MNDWRTRTRVFYGWWLVAALFVVLFFTGGMGFYVFPVFIEPLQSEFGWSITQISAGGGIFAIVFGFASPVVGALIARFGVLRTMLAAATLASVANLGLAALVNLPMLYALNLIAGVVVAGTTLVPAQTAVTNWFAAYRGRAMALTLLGIGFGGMVLPPLNEYLIRVTSWRTVYVIAFVVLWAVVIPVIAVFVRGRPADLGLLPDGAVAGSAGESGHRPSGLPVAAAVRTAAFPLLITVYVLQLTGQSVLNFHFVPFAIKQGGFTPQQAAAFLGLAIGFSVAGKVLFGWLADRFPPARLMAFTGLLAAAGPLALELGIVRAGAAGSAVLWLHAVFFGLGYGGQIILLPLLVGRCFGELHFSRLMGLVMSAFAVGVVVGIPVAGWSYDRLGSYEAALVGCIVAFVLSAVASLALRPQRYRALWASGAEAP
jgi:MFS family permease